MSKKAQHILMYDTQVIFETVVEGKQNKELGLLKLGRVDL